MTSSSLPPDSLAIAESAARHAVSRHKWITWDDALSSAYYGLCLAWQSDRPELGKWPSYAYWCALHQIRQDCRQINRRCLGPQAVRPIAIGHLHDNLPQRGEPPEAAVERRDEIEHVWRLAGALPPRQCEVIRLGLEGLEPDQIARRLGLARHTVLGHQKIAVKGLRAAVG